MIAHRCAVQTQVPNEELIMILIDAYGVERC